MEELKTIMQKFAASGWDLIADPAREWLDGKSNKDTLVSAIKQADEECGNCGCELDQLSIRTSLKQERYLRGEIHSEIFLADIKNMEIRLPCSK